MFDQPNLEKIAQADNYQLLMQQEQQGPYYNTIFGHSFREQIKRMMNGQYNEEMFHQLAKKLESSDPLAQHEGIIGIGKLLNQDDNSPVLQNMNMRNYVKTQLIDKCLQLMRQNQYLHLKYEACYVLIINLAIDEEFLGLIVAKNGVQLFIALLKEQNQIAIQELAALALESIAADSRAAHRNSITQNGGVIVLIQKIKKATTRAQVKSAVWVISSICRAEPFTVFQEINEVCQILCEAIKSGFFHEYDEYFYSTLWALCRLIDNERKQIQVVRKSGILNMLLKSVVDDKRVQNCEIILSIIVILSTGNEVQIEDLVNNKLFFQTALSLTSYPDSAIRLRLCWILSNIAGRGGKLALALIAQQALLKNLSHLLWSQQQRDVCGVCWIYACLANNLPYPIMRLVQLMLSQQIPQAITKLLQSEQITTIQDSLQILETVLEFGDQCQINGQNPILATFLQRTAVSDILNELLQDDRVAASALKIMMLYLARR